MSQIASKNLYELLGNDPELDPERATPVPPTKVIDKPVQRAGKRNGPLEGANGDRTSAGTRGGRQAGAPNNRSEQRDDGLRQDRHRDRVRDSRDRGRGQRGERRGAGRGRGDAGSRTVRDPRVDRHSNTGVNEHDKQAAHGWGGENANAEWTDEQAGDAIAAAELKNDAGFTADTDAKDPAFGSGPDLANEDGAVASFDEEDKTKSYDQYIKERDEKRQTLLGESREVRKANEGSKQKFPEGKAHARAPEDENYMAGGSGKSKREKETKQKNLLTVDGQYYAAPDSGDRGGRGGGRGGRGGRGRGEGRGDSRGGRGGRGRGEGRGSHRGDGPPRGGRGGFNATDQSAFPALGGN